ncbi:hypothetical protein Q4506_17220 [Colwellia sp. 4_MG-2023]|uniref:hypothetical protein n=1 Tax=unclassified Colwellia TaxID=196834 RepID=UPI0026E3B097|nr:MULTISPECIES: hypothetical protein [unclassified Colwellia]MDO6508753.1 hypothetical protein [Colwellia sp. 5_MG-2023]MDO6557418.1 hypothetical protein [Colwellia sp. 4_MG-2023]
MSIEKMAVAEIANKKSKFAMFVLHIDPFFIEMIIKNRKYDFDLKKLIEYFIKYKKETSMKQEEKEAIEEYERKMQEDESNPYVSFTSTLIKWLLLNDLAFYFFVDSHKKNKSLIELATKYYTPNQIPFLLTAFESTINKENTENTTKAHNVS